MTTRQMIVVAAVLLCATIAVAAPPTSLTVQGKLTDALGAPLPAGAKIFSFRIYDANTLGTQVWPSGGVGEIQSITSSTDGLWVGLVGAVNPLTNPVFSDSVRWLEINVDGTTLPRVRLVTGPYAFRVATVDGASGGTITSSLGIGQTNNPAGQNTLASGQANSVFGDRSSVTGGSVNSAFGVEAHVGGGMVNGAFGDRSTIGGGGNNRTRGQYSVVGGGGGPTAADSNAAIGNWSFIGGGQQNHAVGELSAVAGGGGPGGFTSGNTASGAQSFVGGGSGNIAGGFVSAVGGGQSNGASGNHSVVGGGSSNDADTSYSAVLGGQNNTASGTYSAVCGGSSNTASNDHAVVGGGVGNTVSASSATISGGFHSTASGSGAAIGGGAFNIAEGSGAVIGGGYRNQAIGDYTTIAGGGGLTSSDSNYAFGVGSTIGGGTSNIVTGQGATVCGGHSNRARGAFAVIGGGGGPFPSDSNVAGGRFATIPGGQENRANGNYSFAAGRRAKADHGGVFIWADSTDVDFASTATNQFLIRAAGGVGIGTNAPDAPLHVMDGNVASISGNGNASAVFERNGENWIHMLTPNTEQCGILFGISGNSLMGSIRFNPPGTEKGYNIRCGGNNTRLVLDSLGNLTADGCVVGSNIACPSDGRFKRDIQTLPNALRTVEALRGVRYNWKTDEFADRDFPRGEQIGLIAQEVQKVVPQAVVPMTDGYLAVDYSRLVPLLIEGIKEQQKQIATQQEQIDKQGKKINELESKLKP